MNVSSTAPKQGLRKACSGKNFVAIWGRLPSNEIPKEMRPIHSWRRIPGWNEPMLGLPFLAFLAFLAIMYLSASGRILRRHDRFLASPRADAAGKDWMCRTHFLPTLPAEHGRNPLVTWMSVANQKIGKDLRHWDYKKKHVDRSLQ